MHALLLGQNYAFVYPLLVQDEARYTPRLIQRTTAEKDPTALNTLLLALYYSALPDAEATIHSMAQTAMLPAEVQKQVKVIEGSISEARNTDAAKVRDWIKRNKVTISPSATEKDLRDGRRKRMRAISDEALEELEIYTLLIYQKREK